MRYTVVLFLLTALACQSTVRYAGRGGLDDYPPQDSNASTIDQLSGTIDNTRMGKIIAGYLRTPYKPGGTGPLGLDCSGLVYAVYRDYNGTRLPANAARLYKDLKRVDSRDLRYGDLVFFSPNGNEVSHVGIYVGNQKFVHASETSGVIISSVGEDYYRSSFKGARRVLW